MEESIVQFLYKSVSWKDFVWLFLFLKLGGVGYVCCGGYRFISTHSSILLACHCWFDTLLWSPESFLYFVSSAHWFSSLSLSLFLSLSKEIFYNISLSIIFYSFTDRTCYYTLRFELSNRKTCYQNLFYSYWSR